LEVKGGSAAALLRNQLIFWLSHPSGGHFKDTGRQTAWGTVGR